VPKRLLYLQDAHRVDRQAAEAMAQIMESQLAQPRPPKRCLVPAIKCEGVAGLDP
jgi:hypothetical protein